jgi:uncharacterized protein
MQMIDNVVDMYFHWLEIRHAQFGREPATPPKTKVGRNELCPCGSGLKFKKCCGSPAKLH